MSNSTEPFLSWLEGAGGSDATLSERYLGARTDMLNADEATEVANKLWQEYLEAQGVPEPGREWSFVRIGMTMVEISLDESHLKVERFCGAWPMASEKTAALLAKLQAAAP